MRPDYVSLKDNYFLQMMEQIVVRKRVRVKIQCCIYTLTPFINLSMFCYCRVPAAMNDQSAPNRLH